MAKTRLKTALRLIGEAVVIWYGMGTPVPTNLADTIKLMVALLAITYTGWKNHDFTIEGVTGTTITREMKALRTFETEKAEEPADAFVTEDEEDIKDEDGGEIDGDE